MIRIKHLVVIAIFNLLLARCSTSGDAVPDNPASEIYATAQKNMQSGNLKGAITQLEALENRYPFGPYSEQVQLDLIYAYYKSSALPLAKASIDRFMRLNPIYSKIDYVMYMRGLVDMALDDSTLQSFFRIDRSDRDALHARIAFLDFRQLIQHYPDSQYVSDAYKRLVYLKGRLAKHELAVVEYYVQRGAYIAVINRIEQMLCEYPDTKATRDALPLMKSAYEQLHLKGEAEKLAKVIAANPG